MRSTFYLLFATSLLSFSIGACAHDDGGGSAKPGAAIPAQGGPPPAVDLRQKERDASIFQNLDFEELDDTGAPVGWTCGCGTTSEACVVDASASHGSHALVLRSGCYARQDAEKIDPTRAIRFDYFAYGAHQYGTDFVVRGMNRDETDVERLQAEELAESTSYGTVTSNGILRTDGLSGAALVIFNSAGALDPALGLPAKNKPLHVDDIVVVADAPNPEPQAGSLLYAHHVDQYGLVAGTRPATMFTPLPLDYASQVPLYVELTVDPPTAVQSIEYVGEDEHDWGAILHFAPEASAPSLRIDWKAVALVRRTPDGERARVFAKLGDPDQWTHASAIAESDYAPLAATAQGLLVPSASAEDKMRAIIKWTSSHLGGAGEITGLDAKTVFDTHNTSCTGFANTAMAMGRAVGLPGRHVVNVLVGESQQMHSIDEFWLGDALGWRRVEPQSHAPSVPDDYGFLMRLVLPTDEGGDPTGYTGVPLNEFTQLREGASRFGVPVTLLEPFSDCTRGCMNRADRQTVLRGSASDLAHLVDVAREKWRLDRANGLPASRTAIRRSAIDARTTADVEALLGQL